VIPILAREKREMHATAAGAMGGKPKLLDRGLHAVGMLGHRVHQK
jgi:hypothetical protein